MSFPPHINTRIGNLLQIKIVCAIRSGRTGSPERCKTFAPSECAYPTRASSGALLERAGGLCTGEQVGFARAIRMEACEPLASRHASHSHRVMRASRRGAFLRGGLFVEIKLKIIAYILGLIFTIQIYIGTLIFARRAYGVIL